MQVIAPVPDQGWGATLKYRLERQKSRMMVAEFSPEFG
jgi:hypothetical protein